MLYSFCQLFLFFFIYCIIGYVVEVCYCSYIAKKLVLNRGFLIGPYLPIYGISVVLMYYLLQKYADDIIALFVMSCLICSLVEYLTSLILEKIFKVRWWDYSNMRFNIDGRICLLNSIMFGLGSLVFFYFLNPFVLSIFELLNPTIFMILSLVCCFAFTVDLILSTFILAKLKVSSRNFVFKDASEEITYLRNKTLKKYTFFFTRLLNAFPKISGKNVDRYVKMKEKVNEIKQKRKEAKIDYKKEKKKRRHS